MTDRSGRSAARLAAVQALYQMELNGSGAEETVFEFTEHRFGRESETGMAGEIDIEFFGALVRGVPEHQDEIDAGITGC